MTILVQFNNSLALFECLRNLLLLGVGSILIEEAATPTVGAMDCYIARQVQLVASEGNRSKFEALILVLKEINPDCHLEMAVGASIPPTGILAIRNDTECRNEYASICYETEYNRMVIYTANSSTPLQQSLLGSLAAQMAINPISKQDISSSSHSYRITIDPNGGIRQQRIPVAT